MSGILEIIVLIFALYGIASLLWEFNKSFFSGKSPISYFAFVPAGEEDELEHEIRKNIDYAQSIGSEPVILCPGDWNEEKIKIASLIAKECDIFLFTSD